jgi:hypothetical protein
MRSSEWSARQDVPRLLLLAAAAHHELRATSCTLSSFALLPALKRQGKRLV